jgi:hypothetical protein
VPKRISHCLLQLLLLPLPTRQHALSLVLGPFCGMHTVHRPLRTPTRPGPLNKRVRRTATQPLRFALFGSFGKRNTSPQPHARMKHAGEAHPTTSTILKRRSARHASPVRWHLHKQQAGKSTHRQEHACLPASIHPSLIRRPVMDESHQRTQSGGTLYQPAPFVQESCFQPNEPVLS